MSNNVERTKMAEKAMVTITYVYWKSAMDTSSPVLAGILDQYHDQHFRRQSSKSECKYQL